jgi:hypothetical protein
VIRRLARFFALPAGERRLFVEAALSLLAMRLMLALLPFRWALLLLRVAPDNSGSGRIAAAEAAAIGRAIARAAGAVPFRAVCLQQAFAALLMLRRRGLAATVNLGLARDSGGLAAHAWCRSGEVTVTGAETASGFVAVAAFAA